jgi:hypothetical protein
MIPALEPEASVLLVHCVEPAVTAAYSRRCTEPVSYLPHTWNGSRALDGRLPWGRLRARLGGDI